MCFLWTQNLFQILIKINLISCRHKVYSCAVLLSFIVLFPCCLILVRTVCFSISCVHVQIHITLDSEQGPCQDLNRLPKKSYPRACAASCCAVPIGTQLTFSCHDCIHFLISTSVPHVPITVSLLSVLLHQLV